MTRTVLTRLATSLISPERELAAFIAHASGAGAVVSFCGIARARAKGGEAVEQLYLEHYPGMTEKSLERIAQEGAGLFEVSDVRVVHRCGNIPPGETIVFVGAAATHRRAAFEAADYLMDRLKTDACFWKREEAGGESRWIEPTDQDRTDAVRWGRPDARN